MKVEFDHLTIAALSPKDGIDWVAQQFGAIRSAIEGAHPRMATHNHLLRLGATIFLEVIAIDPAAEAPKRPRWFDLDSASMLLRQAERPRLIGWVAAIDDLQRATVACPIAIGLIEPMSRGTLRWSITIPVDGSVVEDGTMPTLIRWPADQPHPTTGMDNLGFTLISLDLEHPNPSRLNAALDAIAFNQTRNVHVRLSLSKARLSASLRTPTGVATFPN